MESYLTTSEADTLADAMPGLAAYQALSSDAAKLAVLALASARLDASRRWQGRKYDLDQVLEFPRLPYPGVVWDDNAGTAVVPSTIKLAVLMEANSIADGSRDRIQEAIANGLASQSTGSLSEAYAARIGAGMNQTLCRDAELLVEKYRLRTGGVL